MVNKVRYIFNVQDKIRILLLLIAIIIGGFFETLGVSIFYPFVELIMDENAINKNEVLALLFSIIPVKELVTKITVLSISIIFLYIIKNAYLILLQNSILNFGYRTRMKLATRLLSAYMEEPYIFHLQKNSAELVRTLQTDCMQFMQLVNNSLQISAEVVMCVVIGVYLLYTSFSITIIVGALLVICVGVSLYLSKKISLKVGLENQRYNAKLLQWINQSLGGIKEVKILEREDYFINEYNTNYKKLIKGAKNNEMLAGFPKYITETVAMTGLIVAVLIKLHFGHGDISTFIPQLTTFAVAAFKLLPAVGKINAYSTSIMYCVPSLDVIYRDLKEVEDISNSKNKVENVEGKHLEEKITINDIVFKYPSAEKAVITNANLTINKGTTVAFVGSSGAGKTTLADIILGLLEPTEGKICVDGWNIQDSMETWHKMIGYIPQTIYLSDDSIIKNVAFGIKEEEIDIDDVRRALKEAQLLDFVESLPDGLNTFVGDRGVRLSGGQRQRIGIARALYHNPDVLVLDEATSALDNDTEKAVMESIDSLKGSKTMIIIAHRLSTIENADVVYEVKDGRVTKQR